MYILYNYKQNIQKEKKTVALLETLTVYNVKKINVSKSQMAKDTTLGCVFSGLLSWLFYHHRLVQLDCNT